MALEFISISRKNKGIGAVVRIIADIVFVAMVFVAVISFDLPWIAMGLVLLSKWRTFAVRPRFLKTNILASLVDFIFGIGIVVITWTVSANIFVQIALMVLYLIWQIVVKPKSTRVWIMAQSLIAQLVGVWALFSVAHLIPSEISLPVVIIGAFVIGFAVARHLFIAIREDSRDLLAIVFGVLFSELALIAFHWVIAYSVFGLILIPQIAFINTAISAVAGEAYASFLKNDKIKWADIRWTVIFSILLISTLLIVFSGLLDASRV